MGHVSPRPVSGTRKGSDFPRRKRRGIGTARTFALGHRTDLGRFGEETACRVLVGYGLVIVSRNVKVGGGEVDILALDGTKRCVVEVRTIRDGGDEMNAIGSAKRRQVWELARTLGIDRVDYVTVRVGVGDVRVRWMPDVS